MAVRIGRIVTGIGVGVVDQVLENRDTVNPPGSFKGLTDWFRLVAAAGGPLVGQFLPRYAALGEDIGLAATPLAVKTIWAAVDMQVKPGATAGAKRFTPAGVKNWAPTNPQGGYRPVS